LSVHRRPVVGEVFGGDGAECGPEMVKKFNWRAAPKFSDRILEIGQVFFGAVGSYHRNEDDFELEVRVVLILVDNKNACCFSDNGSGAGCGGCAAWIHWGNVGGCGSVECLEYGVLEDKAKKPEDGITGCDRHGLILDAFLESF